MRCSRRRARRDALGAGSSAAQQGADLAPAVAAGVQGQRLIR